MHEVLRKSLALGAHTAPQVARFALGLPIVLVIALAAGCGDDSSATDMSIEPVGEEQGSSGTPNDDRSADPEPMGDECLGIRDVCGVCEGDGSSCRGCDGVPGSRLVEDACGVCGGDGSSCTEGCDGVPGSGLVEDACGVCGGDGSSCTEGCDGVLGSDLAEDACGVCGGDGSSCDGSTLSFQADILPLIKGCSALCHSKALKSGALILAADGAYDALVGVEMTTAGCEGEVLVAPGDADASQLVNKLTGVGMCAGKQMPALGKKLTEEQIETIRRWIDAGAAP